MLMLRKPFWPLSDKTSKHGVNVSFLLKVITYRATTALWLGIGTTRGRQWAAGATWNCSSTFRNAHVDHIARAARRRGP